MLGRVGGRGEFIKTLYPFNFQGRRKRGGGGGPRGARAPPPPLFGIEKKREKEEKEGGKRVFIQSPTEMYTCIKKNKPIKLY